MILLDGEIMVCLAVLMTARLLSRWHLNRLQLQVSCLAVKRLMGFRRILILLASLALYVDVLVNKIVEYLAAV